VAVAVAVAAIVVCFDLCCGIGSVCAIHFVTTSIKFAFSKAAATLSLSLNCLLIACSVACVPGVIRTSTLYVDGNDRSNFTRKHNPINVAIEQCGMVGVN